MDLLFRRRKTGIRNREAFSWSHVFGAEFWWKRAVVVGAPMREISGSESILHLVTRDCRQCRLALGMHVACPEIAFILSRGIICTGARWNNLPAPVAAVLLSSLSDLCCSEYLAHKKVPPAGSHRDPRRKAVEAFQGTKTLRRAYAADGKVVISGRRLRKRCRCSTRLRLRGF